MGARYDQQQVTINNASGSQLSLGTVGDLQHGEWDQNAVQSIANGTTTLAFSTYSCKDSHVGPGPGSVSYILPDGNTLFITFDLGDNGPSYVTAAMGGATANKYSVSNDYCDQTSTYSGFGKNFYTTIKILNGPGFPSVTCSQD